MNLAGGDILTQIRRAFEETPASFPRGGVLNYPAVLDGWIANLDANLLPYVTIGGVSRDGGHLTLHDKEHIDRVRTVASSLVGQAESHLSPYELVLLLCAVYLHDIGNILGRGGHEEAIPQVIAAAGAPAGFDAVEVRAAIQIAGVHGGRIKGSKDTIGTLQDQTAIYGEPVRMRLLAALLRLADELADDPARANRIQMSTAALDRGAEVYHYYAASLHTARALAPSRTIELRFDFSDPDLFCRQFGKGAGVTYMIDEIFDRSLKTYREARYCSRFLRPLLDFDRVSVDVAIFDSGFGPILESVRYTISETGYGDETQDIYALSPELSTYKGNGPLTATLLAERLNNARSEP